jgi:hypothetical protein
MAAMSPQAERQLRAAIERVAKGKWLDAVDVGSVGGGYQLFWLSIRILRNRRLRSRLPRAERLALRSAVNAALELPPGRPGPRPAVQGRLKREYVLELLEEAKALRGKVTVERVIGVLRGENGALGTFLHRAPSGQSWSMVERRAKRAAENQDLKGAALAGTTIAIAFDQTSEAWVRSILGSSRKTVRG